MKDLAYLIAAIAFLIVVLGGCPSHAAANCYDRLELAKYRPPPTREITILVDETAPLSEALAGELLQRVGEAVRPGDRVSVIAFSTFTRARFLRELAVHTLDQAPTASAQRTMPMRRVRELEGCLTLTRAAIVKDVQKHIAQALKGASNEIAQSEIVLSLREIGARLRAVRASEKLLLLVTDGLEHSSVTSFYRNRAMRTIDPDAELERVRARRLLADLAGARVFVFGGGLSTAEGEARDHAALLALEAFWTGYVKESNGALIAFGKPALLIKLE